ncbi:MAG: Ku protein [Desulforudis sp.]|nr:MAG: Ku protein [Desulforudis sp.]
MRPLWKGAMTFGLVYIPVKLYTATERQDIRFNMLHVRCHTPIQYRKYCPHCEEEVQLDDIVRGYEYEKGRYVILSDEELAGSPAEGARNIALLDFVHLGEIDPVYFDKSYYLAPSEGGQKVYELLRQAMEQSGKVGIARVTIRSKETLACVRVSNRTLVMNTMLYPDEVRRPELLPELDYQVKIHDNERKMALSLVENLAAPFEPGKYTDERREALGEIIRAKVAGDVAVRPPEAQPAKVVDLMEALKTSIEQAKKERTPDKPQRKTAKKKEAGAG